VIASFLLNDFVAHQSKKRIFSGVEKPAKMRQAGTACGILPCVSGKPAELTGCFSLDQASGCLPETTDLKGSPRRVKKGMLMLPVYWYLVSDIGDYRAAATTD